MRPIDELLTALRNKLLEMSALVQSAIRDSVSALESGQESRARAVLKRETDVNRLELEIDAIVTNILALDQPVAGDLRFVTAAAKINSNLERVGDLAVNIAERSESLSRESGMAIHTDMPRLAELVEAMIERALDAFVQRNVAEARSVLLSDDTIDALRDAIFTALIRQMKQSAESVQSCVDLMLATLSLERIAAHATNIAEAVVFMIEGVDVRHHRPDPAATPEPQTGVEKGPEA